MAKMLMMIAGESTMGKSASLMNLKDPRSVFYLGTEANKPLPFSQEEGNKFQSLKNGIQDPKAIFELADKLEGMDEIKTIVVDSLTFLMDMYESVHVLKAEDSRAEWGEYQQFFKKLMQEKVSASKKNWIFLAHNDKELMNNGNYRYYVPVKGALKKQGMESYFSIIVYARRINIRDLEEYDLDENLCRITDRERRLGYKHVFQCDITADYAESRIRAPMGCFSDNQIFMDNDAQLLLDHLAKYYGLEL